MDDFLQKAMLVALLGYLAGTISGFIYYNYKTLKKNKKGKKMKNNALKDFSAFLNQSKQDIENAKKADEEFRIDIVTRIENIENILYERFGLVMFQHKNINEKDDANEG